jgi:uncharacterized protein (TIGR00251 family)
VLTGNTLTLYCHVQPSARNSRLCGIHNRRLKIQLKAPPVDGKANRELITYLARMLGLPKKNITISSGLGQRQKTVRVTELNEIPPALQKLLDE